MGFSMRRSGLYYSPLDAAFMVVLALLLGIAVALIEIGALSFAYERLGIDRQWVYVLLLGSILGAFVNIPVARFHGHTEVDNTVVSFMGVRYRVPQVVETGRTVLAVNLGGAVVPAALAGYLIAHDALGWRALWAVLIVSLFVNRMARPVQSVGIVVPTLLPPVLAVLTAEVIGGRHVAALAYAAGTLGALIGADLLNLPRIRRWGAPVVSIGGAGTFDGIFVTGVVAVLLASI